MISSGKGEGHNSQHIWKIDVLRGIAILCVFLYHTQLVLFPAFESRTYKEGFLDQSKTQDYILNMIPTAYGWSGVQLFLIISGFLIHNGNANFKHSFNVTHFFWKRFWRIYPPYFVALFVVLIYRLGKNDLPISETNFANLFSHAFLIHNLSGNTFFGINPSFWSLALEAQLYLLYPLLLLLLFRSSINWIFFLSLGLSFILLISELFVFRMDIPVHIYTNVFQYWFIWISGATLAENFNKGRKIFKGYAGTICMLLSIAVILSGNHIYAPNYVVFIITGFWLSFSEWFLYQESIKRELLICKFLIFTGMVSYGFYLLHQPIITDAIPFFIRLLTTTNIKNPFITYIVSLLFILMALLILSYYYYKMIEQPSINAGKSNYKKFFGKQ